MNFWTELDRQNFQKENNTYFISTFGFCKTPLEIIRNRIMYCSIFTTKWIHQKHLQWFMSTLFIDFLKKKIVRKKFSVFFLGGEKFGETPLGGGSWGCVPKQARQGLISRKLLRKIVELEIGGFRSQIACAKSLRLINALRRSFNQTFKKNLKCWNLLFYQLFWFLGGYCNFSLGLCASNNWIKYTWNLRGIGPLQILRVFWICLM